MTALRLSIGAIASAAALFGGSWAGGAFAGLPRGRPEAAAQPAYSAGGAQIRVGDSLAVNGQPMELSLFYTADPPARVVRFYADAFRARGLLPVVCEQALAHVAAFGPADGLQRFVNAVPEPDGRTLVLIGSMSPGKPLRPGAGVGAASFPIPPRHRGLVAFRSVDGGVKAESAQFVSATAPSEVARFYRAALVAEGFREESGSLAEALLTFTKPGVTLQVALQELEAMGGAAVFVTRTEDGTP